jgi:hypothetical protein
MLVRIFQHLRNSDFALAFPDHPLQATLHHHRQIWWTSTDAGLITQLSQTIKEPRTK